MIALKTQEGRMGRIDTGTRMFVFRPDKDFAVDVYWSVGQDEKLSKFKERHMARITYETDKQGKHWLTEIISTYKPGDKQKGDYQKKDEGLILKEVLYKALVDLYIETANLEEGTFDSAAEAVLKKTEEHYLKLMGDGK